MTAARQIMNCHKKFELTKNIRHYMLLVKTEATCIDSVFKKWLSLWHQILYICNMLCDTQNAQYHITYICSYTTQHPFKFQDSVHH